MTTRRERPRLSEMLAAPAERPAIPVSAQATARGKARPHASLYLDPRVLKTIKQIALDHDKSQHDLLVEGVDMLIRKYRPSLSVKKILEPDA